MAGYFDLCRGGEHIFDEDAVAHGWVVYQSMGDGAYQFSCCGAR